jgi:four helix bundle protein
MDYRNLVFYQKARQVVKGVSAEIKKWPRTARAEAISKQLFRSATSIGASIAEGHGRHQGPEYIHFLYIAQGSANEVDHWLNTALDCGIGDSTVLHQLIIVNNETRKMLKATLDSLHKKQMGKVVRETLPPYSPIPFSPSNDDD